MKHNYVKLVIALWICLGSAGILGQSGADYDTLVQQGKTQLQSANNDAALASANAAITLDAGRWEAYAGAGGALINLKQCDEAKANLNAAIKLARR
jgi:Flp pilus assembly protein TadD